MTERPDTADPVREIVSVRMDPDVLAQLREPPASILDVPREVIEAACRAAHDAVSEFDTDTRRMLFNSDIEEIAMRATLAAVPLLLADFGARIGAAIRDDKALFTNLDEIIRGDGFHGTWVREMIRSHALHVESDRAQLRAEVEHLKARVAKYEANFDQVARIAGERIASDSAWASVWLHGDWRSLTRKMTTAERNAAADAVERRWAMDQAEDPSLTYDASRAALRWWVEPTCPRCGRYPIAEGYTVCDPCAHWSMPPTPITIPAPGGQP